jgi:hypothetical protein
LVQLESFVTIKLVTVMAIALAVLMGVMVVFQMLLVAGVPWGRAAWGGQNEVLPNALPHW